MSYNHEATIKDHSSLMAEQMPKIAKQAGSEEDIRHEVNSLIDKFIKEAGLDVRGRHEYGLAGGRIDSKYGGVVIEYKDPKGAGRITLNKESSSCKMVVEQVARRFVDLQSFERVGLERILGVGCDGEVIVFVKWRGNKVEADDPQPVTTYTVERLLRAIVSLGARGLSFTPQNLAENFGSDSPTGSKSIRSIYSLLSQADNPKAATFFRQWQILFGEVCGYDLHGQNERIKKLAVHYLIPAPEPAALLFTVHTYFAILIKMLAAEIVASFSPLGVSALKRLASAPTSAKLREELKYLEQGGIWTTLGIRNFLEGDLFSWYLDAWSDDCADAVRRIVETLEHFDPTTLSVDPAESCDLLKQLYQQLFPKSVRHDLGEYYTPDWLADLTLDELGYDGNPDKRLLDPACGSGTFLVMAINRVKGWFAEHRHECCFGEDALLQKILNNIIGFDLNPLAVMAARTNYLLAIRDLLLHTGSAELPVYLCDSILTPSEYGDLFSGGLGKVRQLKTSAETFIIPNEIAENRELIGRYANALEYCIRLRQSPEEFLQRCQNDGLPYQEKELHLELYRQLQTLDRENMNGIWARIIKNAFAPLFVGKVDFVAGNPPWINWESLPEVYRQSTASLWKEYGLFNQKGYKAKLGGGKDDLSVLLTYVAHDVYLGENGRLGFLITQSIFKTIGGGEGFRTLEYERDGKKVYLKPLAVHDFSDFQPFEGASNRTSIIIVEKNGIAFKYPVPYTIWKKNIRGKIKPEMKLSEVKNSTTRSELAAQPINDWLITSPWLTAPALALPGIQKVLGKSVYRAYAGCCTWLNSVYWVNILCQAFTGNYVVQNLNNVGKIEVKELQHAIEPDLLYPLLRGRDARRWFAHPSLYLILTNISDKLAGIPLDTLKFKYPEAYEYLKTFEGNLENPEYGTLRGRSGFRKYFKPSDPFYSIYNVGPYTMSKWKVVWREQSSFFQAALIGSHGGKPVIPDHKLMLVPCASQEEGEPYPKKWTRS